MRKRTRVVPPRRFFGDCGSLIGISGLKARRIIDELAGLNSGLSELVGRLESIGGRSPFAAPLVHKISHLARGATALADCAGANLRQVNELLKEASQGLRKRGT